MARGSISHISLTVSDLERSAAFYDRVFEFIGFKTRRSSGIDSAGDEDTAEGVGRTELLNIDPSIEGRVCAETARSKCSWI
jgi:catechol 2,3-dioxygenase-like lactoylglutathione lyase family enzyme